MTFFLEELKLIFLFSSSSPPLKKSFLDLDVRTWFSAFLTFKVACNSKPQFFTCLNSRVRPLWYTWEVYILGQEVSTRGEQAQGLGGQLYLPVSTTHQLAQLQFLET